MPDRTAPSIPARNKPSLEAIGKPADKEKPEPTSAQLTTAQIVYSSLVLDRFAQSARAELPGLKRRSLYRGDGDGPRSDDDIVLHRVADLVSAYSTHTEMQNAEDPERIRNQFISEHDNHSELLHTAEVTHLALQKEREELFENAGKVKPWSQRRLRHKAKRTARRHVGDELDLLYAPTDTSMKEETARTRKVRATVGLNLGVEAATHYTGVAFEKMHLMDNLDDLGVTSTPGKIVATVGLNAIVYGLVFHTNAKKNTEMVMEEGIGTSITSQAADESAKYNGSNKDERKKRTTRADRRYHAGWEGFYLWQTVQRALDTGLNAALDYNSGAAIAGIATNLVKLTGFEVRKMAKKRKLRKEAALDAMPKDEGTVVQFGQGSPKT
jgi:hypothetical protein